MICHQDKCLFVHIPKTAGQSIESIFVKRLGLTWQEREALLLKPNSEPSKGPPRLAHLKAGEYTSCGHISTRLYQQYFKFSFVRNPWERIVSEYNYRRSHGDAIYQQDFKSFLFNSFPQVCDDNYLLAKDYYRHVIPQVDFLYDQEGNCLVDFIGRFETLQQDFDKVCKQLALDLTTLPHKNKTAANGFLAYFKRNFFSLFNQRQKKHYSHYIDLESREYIAEIYAKDISVFGYHFEKTND
ncbi:sulfotransferase family protein [Colwelliaceae bacterium 6441]